MTTELKDYLSNKGVQFKGQGKELCCDCIFCGDTKKRMYVNEQKNVFFCHNCNATGNIWAAKKHYGDIAISKPVFTNYKKPKPIQSIQDDAIEYLTKERGLKQETIEFFKVKSKDGKVAIPYIKDGEVVNYKYREIKEKRWSREKDCESILFNRDNIDKTKPVFIFESEIDCMSAWQIGIKNSVASTTGASSLSEDAIDILDSCIDTIYIAYDNDKAGEDGADVLSKKVGLHRCKRFRTPLKDMNETLMAGYTLEDMREIARNADEYTLNNLIHVSKTMDRLESMFRRPDRGSGYKLGLEHKFNRALGGMRGSEITILTGETSSGKTTYGIGVCDKVLSEGKNVLIASTEMKTEKVVQKLFTMHQGKSFLEFGEEDLADCMKFYSKKGLFFIDVHGKLLFEDLRQYIIYAKRRYNVDFVFLDHLHFFLDLSVDQRTMAIEMFIRDLVSLALETELPIWIVVHPSKLHNNNGYVNMDNLKGASALKQDAHNVLSLWRDKEREEAGINEVYVEFQKVRDDSGQGGKIKYSFNSKSQAYFELG